MKVTGQNNNQSHTCTHTYTLTHIHIYTYTHTTEHPSPKQEHQINGRAPLAAELDIDGGGLVGAVATDVGAATVVVAVAE